MAIVTYNIKGILQQTYGITVPVKSIMPKRSENQINLGEVKRYLKPQQRTSFLLTPVYETLEILNDDNSVLYLFPDNTYISGDQAKIIEKTRITKRKGTVKEYIGLDDWQIQIYGVICNYDSYDYPEEKVAELIRVYEMNKALKVQGMSLNVYGIYNLVLEKLSLAENQDTVGCQAFSIQATSDEPIELQLQ